VRATNAAGSTDSPVITVTTEESVPAFVAAPVVSPVAGRYDQLLIEWSAPERPNGIIRNYFLQRNDSTPWNVDARLQYVDEDLSAYTFYSYAVSACTSVGCTTSGRSTSRTNEHVPSAMLPAEATVLNSSAVRLSWMPPTQPNGRITGFQLSANGTLVYRGPDATRIVTGLQPYALYAFVISACTSAGCTSSQATYARPDEALPTNLSAPSVHVTGTRSVEISWLPPVKPNGLITTYELHRNNTLIQLTTDTWYVDYDCRPGTTYAYRVTAFNSKGGVDSPDTLATTFSSAPEGLGAPHVEMQSSTDVVVSWHTPAQPNGHIVNYTLYMSHRVVYTGLSLSTVVRDLSPWTSYSFHVSACTRSGCTVSRDAHIKTPEAAPDELRPPRLSAAVIGQVLVEWSVPLFPNGLITAYELRRRRANATTAQGRWRCNAVGVVSHICNYQLCHETCVVSF